MAACLLQANRQDANRQDKEGASPPERDAQLAYLNEQATRFLARGQPVVSVDTKKTVIALVATSRRTKAAEASYAGGGGQCE